MYSVVIMSNGSIFTVGNSSQEISDPVPNVIRVIRHIKVDASRISLFKTFVENEGFLTLPGVKDAYNFKPNFVCDTFFYTKYASHRVCRPEDEMHKIIANINNEIRNIIASFNDKSIYRPASIFVESKTVSSRDVKGTLLRKTSRSLRNDFDPLGMLMGSDYTMAAYVLSSSLSQSYNSFMTATNYQYSYTDDYIILQFIVYINDLSVNDHPSPIYPTATWTGDYTYDNNGSTGLSVLIILFFVFLIVSLSICVIFIIRRRMNKNKQEYNFNENDSSSSEEQQTNPQMTSYPIFVQSNQMNGMPMNGMQSYPIFVQSNQMNGMQMNGMQMNGMQTNVPIIFPQPQVFYPMQTNQVMNSQQ
jgi:hypothetical protein